MSARRRPAGPWCKYCGKPYISGPDYGRYVGWCWPCVRLVKGMTGGDRR